MSSRRIGLAIVESNQTSFQPVSDVPRTRADCPTQRPCAHVHCRYHLWTIVGGPDGTRAGRPGLAAVGRQADGRTVSIAGALGAEDRAGTTLEPRWLEDPTPDSCALDVAARGPRGNVEIGEAIGRHRTLVAREVRAAARAAISSASELGVTSVDLAEMFRVAGGKP